MNARFFSDKINVTFLSQPVAIFTAPSARICVSPALTPLLSPLSFIKIYINFIYVLTPRTQFPYYEPVLKSN